ncbi:hypothetical protein GCM10010520_51590 [Rhizobium viscosum]
MRPTRRRGPLASGLAIADAESCGCKIDQPRLEQYVVKVGLSTPEGLGYIGANVPRKAKELPSQAECTMSRATAKSIGVLAGEERGFEVPWKRLRSTVALTEFLAVAKGKWAKSSYRST